MNITALQPNTLHPGEIGPLHLLAHGVACRVVAEHNREVVLQACYAVEAAFAASLFPGSAEGQGGRRILQFCQTTPDGALGATQQVSNVADAAMSQFEGLDGGITSAVVFGQGSEEGPHRAFGVLAVSGVSHSV